MDNHILASILILVICTNMISTYKKKFFNDCDHTLDPIVTAFVIELSVTVILGIICIFRKNTYNEIQYITSHPNSHFLMYSIGLTILSTVLYYYILNRTQLSKMSLIRSCLSILLGVITSQYFLKEEINNSTKVGVVLLIISLYLINGKSEISV